MISLEKVFMNFENMRDTQISVIEWKITYLASRFDSSVGVYKLLQIC
jgi:hypothetical protein